MADKVADGTAVTDIAAKKAAALFKVATDFLDCISCDSIRLVSDVADKFVNQMSVALAGPVQLLFMSLAGVWVAISAVKLMVGSIDPRKLVLETFFVILSFGLLQSQGVDLVKNVYKVSLGIMANTSTVAFNLTGHIDVRDDAGLAKLAETAESGFGTIFKVSIHYFTDAGWLNPMKKFLFPALLFFPYLYVIVVFFSKIVISMFRLMMIGVFSPFLVMALGFPWGMPMARAGLNTIIAAIAIMFAASAAFGLLIFAVHITTQDLINVNLNEPTLASGPYLAIVALGFAGGALITEAIGIATTLTSGRLDNSSSAVLSAKANQPLAIAKGLGRSGALGVKGMVVAAAINAIGKIAGRAGGASAATKFGLNKLDAVARPFVPK